MPIRGDAACSRVIPCARLATAGAGGGPTSGPGRGLAGGMDPVGHSASLSSVSASTAENTSDAIRNAVLAAGTPE